MKKFFATATTWITTRYLAIVAVFFPSTPIEDASEAARLAEFDQMIWQGLLRDLGSASDPARLRAIRAIENGSFAPGFRRRNPEHVKQLNNIAATEVATVEQRQLARFREAELKSIWPS